MAEYATYDELVEAFEGTIPDAAKLRLEGLLRRASAILTARVPSLPDRIASGEIDADIPRGIVTDAVLRVHRNPSGTKSQTAGPFGHTLTDRAADAGLTFSDDDLALLAPPEPIGLRSVALTIPRWRWP